MNIHLQIIGIILIVLAIVHIIFPRYFKWQQELSLISHINREMMYVHTFFIALTVLLMGSLCLISASEIITTSLGKKVSLGFGIFWLIRLVIQFFGYSSLHWRGKRFETIIHVLFAITWAYITTVFMYIYFI